MDLMAQLPFVKAPRNSAESYGKEERSVDRKPETDRDDLSFPGLLSQSQDNLRDNKPGTEFNTSRTKPVKSVQPVQQQNDVTTSSTNEPADNKPSIFASNLMGIINSGATGNVAAATVEATAGTTAGTIAGTIAESIAETPGGISAETTPEVSVEGKPVSTVTAESSQVKIDTAAVVDGLVKPVGAEQNAVQQIADAPTAAAEGNSATTVLNAVANPVEKPAVDLACAATVSKPVIETTVTTGADTESTMAQLPDKATVIKQANTDATIVAKPVVTSGAEKTEAVKTEATPQATTTVEATSAKPIEDAALLNAMRNAKTSYQAVGKQEVKPVVVENTQPTETSAGSTELPAGEVDIAADATAVLKQSEENVAIQAAIEQSKTVDGSNGKDKAEALSDIAFESTTITAATTRASGETINFGSGSQSNTGDVERSIKQQVVRNLDLDLAGKIGKEKVIIKLNPEKLGQVEVEIAAEGDRLTIVMTTSGVEAEAALREGITELAEGIAEKTARFQHVDVRVDTRDSQDQKQDSRSNDKQENQREKSDKDSDGHPQHQHQQQHGNQIDAQQWAQLHQEG